jgi:hypothetical protein
MNGKIGNDWHAIMYNITKARQRWAMISKILTWQGSTPKVMGYYYKAVYQAILLYGCETWVISSATYKRLESFHHRIARQISRCRIHVDPNTGEWICPPLLMHYLLLDCYHYLNILSEEDIICYLGLHKVSCFNKAHKLEVVLTHHDAFIGHLK